ncbi:hypothetical protein C8P63_10855 [Melghirimyces profundicolus]|uniref:Cytosolic protein n=2 Tax=Melghirimyces profundicolus TaxID=1242148 RepID=A0A2T6BXF5_9BACL|nr:hypothetical protein C8P63_10855 [Melghirimyces profundicolus]
MYMGRTLDELTGVPVSEWEMEELSYHHFAMSQLSPLMNAQGISLHHQVIKEIERRGGLHDSKDENHPGTDRESYNEHRFTF